MVNAVSCLSFLDFMGDLIAFRLASSQIASMRLLGDRELLRRVDVADIAEIKVSYERGMDQRIIKAKSSLFIDLPIKAKSLCIVLNLIK